jgi:hypothetical protein
MIASARKTLFSNPPAQDNNEDKITMETSRSKKWIPIKAAKRTNTATAKQTALTAPSSSRKDATFAVGTNFKEWKVPAVKTTPAKEVEKTVMMKECIAWVRVKILAGAADIQETVMGLLSHCLAILEEHDKNGVLHKCGQNSQSTQVDGLPSRLHGFP